MNNISSKRFNWVRLPKAWEQNKAWRARQQASSQKFLNINAGANDSFAQANYGLASGMATIAAQVALKRVQDEVAAKRLGAQPVLNKQV